MVKIFHPTFIMHVTLHFTVPYMVGGSIQHGGQVCVAGCACVVSSIPSVCRVARESIMCGLRRSKNRHVIINFAAVVCSARVSNHLPKFCFPNPKTPEPEMVRERERTRGSP